MSAPTSISPAASYLGQTLEQHLMSMQRRAVGATGDFTGLFASLSLAGKIISSQVNKAGLANILGLTGKTNVQGEEVKKLDIFAHDTIVSTIQQSGNVCIMSSEERAEPVRIDPKYPRGKYVLQFDPLDGSSNIDVNTTIGTIFSVHRRVSEGGGDGEMRDLLQPGKDIIAAGYIVYGSSSMFVYSSGHGVHGFTFDPSIGEFFLSHPDIRIPTRGEVYSVNEGHMRRFPDGVRNWARWLKRLPSEGGPDVDFSLRYIGSLVGDVHRTLLQGGVFAYPGTQEYPNGKIRLLYEASPIAFLMEQAGGRATDGTRRLLDIQPEELHQRTPIFVGSADDVADLEDFLSGKRS